ncbi:RrF2 family transcriptional regulator [Fodinibius saliphilus]|uniref:RrF2 family transcriptional regulator n=1 Tax=Fodinibius saliphilus TaxID=1920650 RepID=UPI0011095F03|nr:Rrf2 family transcriptional regulator [Fodinibius saliphilus]
MHLPQTAEYALRAMACIALKKDGRPVSSNVLARATGIPGHYLSKILRKMVEADLVTSQKGHGGGFRLAKEPSEIKFKSILATVDYKIEPNSCVFGWDECDSEDPCPLHNTWSQLKDSFQWWAENTTLQDVIDRPGEAETLLDPMNTPSGD